MNDDAMFKRKYEREKRKVEILEKNFEDKTRELFLFEQELAKANEKLKETDRRKSDFVANVSHEFRSPLTIIKTSIELLEHKSSGSLTLNQQKMTNVCMRTTERLIRLVNNLLDISQIEQGGVVLNLTDVDIPALIVEICEAYEQECKNKKLSYIKNISKDTGSAFVDRDKIYEVIVNLLNNAIKYTPEGGSVTLKTSGSKDEIFIEVSDTGPGIPQDYKEKIFDKFERIMSEKQEGTGLGLPITKDLLILHGGNVCISETSSKGTTFKATFPRKPPTITK